MFLCVGLGFYWIKVVCYMGRWRISMSQQFPVQHIRSLEVFLTSEKLNKLIKSVALRIHRWRAGDCPLPIGEYRKPPISRAEIHAWKPVLGQKTWTPVDTLQEAQHEQVWVSRTPGESSHTGTPHLCKSYLLKFCQVLKMNIGGKFPCLVLLAGREEKKSF